MTLFRVRHHTQYQYAYPVSLSHNELCLIPRFMPFQNIINAQVLVQPVPLDVEQRQEYYGNNLTYFSIKGVHQELRIESEIDIEVWPRQMVDLSNSRPWEDVRDQLRNALPMVPMEAREFVFDSPMIRTTSEILDYAHLSFERRKPLLLAVEDLVRRIHQDFYFDPQFSTVKTPLEQIFHNRRGVCQDFAHIAIACIRAMGLAARYVSGYLETLAPPGMQKLIGVDASHAWFAVYSLQYGWVDFDPTNNCRPSDRHITIGWGRDYSDVAPVKGIVFGGGDMQLKVAVDISRLN